MELLLSTILSYLVSLAANLSTDAIHARREEGLREQLEREDALSKALASTRPIGEELRTACAELARNRHHLGVTPQEQPLWRLLSDEIFQADLAEWLMAGGILEGNAVKDRLLRTMEAALADGGASQEQIFFLKTSYFEALDKAVFAHPILAHWRHQLSLDYLREQVTVLRRLAEEGAGVYSLDKQWAALDRYCEKALATWDIIDLSNLPEGDIHIATQKLLLRQLYTPLRITVELGDRGEGDDAALAGLEEQRVTRRRREAGHLFADEPDRPSSRQSRSPVGERLTTSRRLVVLGDPGGGKTTLLRWLATAYLLRHKGDPAFSQVPDMQTLPDRDWIPVLIRCRDLGDADLCRCFTDFLTQHLHKTELLPEEADVMRAVILDHIASGEALLLVDGLDEITNPRVRMMFCQELERTSARYPNVPMVVTSRIVGYRDMPYRMGSGFEHGVIAELDREDKDLFARRWVDVTEQHQSAAEKARRARELLDALHSSDRIERLTGNPMLLTTLALVKRKVGKLPNRRTKLYAEAVSVLLNWNPRLYETIEEEEAIPQLEYLAYEMCRGGVQRLTEDEVLDLLDRLRTEYPNIRAVRRRDPQAFLGLLEARSSILIKSGGIWRRNESGEKAVWEFRHLTFQEYLAARALLDGRYPGRDKAKSLAEQVAPLAGAVEVRVPSSGSEVIGEVEVPESWREALRLLVADCKDDDVDGVLLAILNPMPGEDAAVTGRPRAALAALCLADEPNISEQTATRVLAEFAGQVGQGDGEGPATTSLDFAALELGGSMWAQFLKRSLMHEYCRRSPEARAEPGCLWGLVEVAGWRRSGVQPAAGFEALVERLKSGDRVEALSAALAAMAAAYEENAANAPGLTEGLFALLGKGGPESDAGALALLWLSGGWLGGTKPATWLPSEPQLEVLVDALSRAPFEDSDLKCFLIHILGKVSNQKSLNGVISKLDDPDADVRGAVNEALGQLGDKQAVPLLLARLDDPDARVRVAVIQALGQLGDKQAVPSLLATLDAPEVELRRAVIEALGQLGDKQAVPPLLAKLDEQNARVRSAVIGALGQVGGKQAVPVLLAKLDDPDADVRRAVIEALGQVGGKQAVPPLLGRLDDRNAAVRWAVVAALGHLGDKRAVRPLLGKLDDPDADVRRAVIEALGRFGDAKAVEPLIGLLKDHDYYVCAAAAAALTVLGSERGSSALTEFLDHASRERREAAVGELARMRGNARERMVLSRRLHGGPPWMDPREPISETRIADAARKLVITTQEVRSFYESIAADFHLRFA